MSTLVSVSDFMRDLYPQEGSRIKQWVVDSRRDAAWERETCPRVQVEEHDDNTGTSCRNVGEVPWTWLQHDCCSTCCERADATKGVGVQAWLSEKAKRPKPEADRSKLSDEIQPSISITDHPLVKWLKR